MSILCPYCGTPQAFAGTNTVCVKCSAEVPRNYIANARQRPPIWMVTVGYSQHGKSTFVDGLTTVIEKLIRISPGTVYTYLDEATRKKIIETRKGNQQGILPGSTQRPVPMLISLPHFLGNESNTLVIYDMPGEIFDDPGEIEKYSEVIKQAETIWFLISLRDMEKDQEGRSIADLVNIYVGGLQQLNAPIKGRRVLVVYTKSDLILEGLPAHLQDYLAEDPYSNLPQMTMEDVKKAPFRDLDYWEKMQAASQWLKEYTYDKVPGGDALIGLVEHNEMALSFTAVSSVPGADGRTIGTAIPRYRVLDPLIWSLMGTQGGTTTGEIALIFDAGRGFEAVWAESLPIQFFDLLQSQNSMGVRTFYTGQREALKMARPERAPKKIGLRFIGPILDTLTDDSHALVVVNGPIEDLLDYYYSSWHDRLYVVSLGNKSISWPHFSLLQDSDPEEVVAKFLALIKPDKG